MTTTASPQNPPAGGSSEPILVERERYVATVFLNRPEKRNAMNMAMFDVLPRAMAELGADDGVRAIVIAAKGPAFSVGIDLTTFATLNGPDDNGEGVPARDGTNSRKRRSRAAEARRIYADVLSLQGSISSVADCPKPVIAAIHGWCLGGGVDLSSACDIRLCAADATFSVRETRMAMVADIGSLQRLPEILPAGYVAELAYTGRDIDAARAEKIGLVNAVYPTAEATLAAAQAMAAEIAGNSPLAVQGTKAVLGEARRSRVESGLRFVAAWNAGQLQSDDLTEAVTAFFDRRPPDFTGT